MKIIQKSFSNPLSWLVVIALILSLLASCSSEADNAIIGKWSNGTETMEFFKDNTIIVVDTVPFRETMTGTYKAIDKGRMRVELGGLGALAGPMVATYSISGDELTWAFSDDRRPSKYKRIK